MNPKYIFLPKPDTGESTAMKRVGLVCYWIGIVWLLPFLYGAYLNIDDMRVFIMIFGFFGFFVGRGLLFILANR